MANEAIGAHFERHRPHLNRVAFRLLGGTHEADDAVQEAWLRLARADAAEVQNLGGWLTTAVVRISLDMLRSRRSRRESPLSEVEVGGGIDPEREAMLADPLGAALMAVLQRLAPLERVAFVLHDLFEMSFEEISPIVERSSMAARQLASRGRRKLRDVPESAVVQQDRQRLLVEAFRTASREGDLQGLIGILAPDIVLRADSAAVALGAQPETHGAEGVANTFSGRARNARAVLVQGRPGLAWIVAGQPRVVFRFTVESGRIVGMELLAEALDQIDLKILK
jgi:RNA polymerase sigma-70 factor (ECF subfamily)